MSKPVTAYDILESLRIQALSDTEILEWIISSYLSEPTAKAMMLSAKDELLKE